MAVVSGLVDEGVENGVGHDYQAHWWSIKIACRLQWYPLGVAMDG